MRRNQHGRIVILRHALRHYDHRQKFIRKLTGFQPSFELRLLILSPLLIFSHRSFYSWPVSCTACHRFDDNKTWHTPPSCQLHQQLHHPRLSLYYALGRPQHQPTTATTNARQLPTCQRTVDHFSINDPTKKSPCLSPPIVSLISALTQQFRLSLMLIISPSAHLISNSHPLTLSYLLSR